MFNTMKLSTLEPLVSILIAAYNAEEYIAQALESVLAQTYSNVEIIVINDGSTDNTPIILEKYRNKGVAVFYQENKGQGAALNHAFKLSKGDYIKFVDADDLLSPNSISLQMQRLSGSTEYIASSEWARFYNNDIQTAVFKPEEVWRDLPALEWIIKSIKKGVNMMQCAIFLIPRNILLKSGLWDERLTLIIDFEFFTRVILHSTGVRFTEGAKIYYRSGILSSVSHSKSRSAMESALLASELSVSYILAAENSPRTRNICADVYQILLFSVYPKYPDLAKIAESKVKELGGSNMIVSGGKVLQNIAAIVGWKLAKRIQLFFYQLGYLKFISK
jgi:glycosyltransferase involved in cell wall biosynthesis